MDENSEITFQRFSCHLLKWVRVSSVELIKIANMNIMPSSKLLQGENSFCVVNVSVVDELEVGRSVCASVVLKAECGAFIKIITNHEIYHGTPLNSYNHCFTALLSRHAVAVSEFHIIAHHAQRLMFKNHITMDIWTANSPKLSISWAYCIIKQFLSEHQILKCQRWCEMIPVSVLCWCFYIDNTA